tara:strand:- start:98 stop:1066 length:969 start_codon:yes stop_codon:yes gene_type:complete
MSRPNFIIKEKAWNTMQQYAGIAYDKDKNEISGLIPYKLTKHPVSNETVYELFDPVILKQENSGTTTELDGEALRDYQVRAGMKYGTDIKFCWWHSHHTMGAFWSGTDDKEIKAWKNDSWSLALVINLFGEYKLNVSVWKPIEFSEDVPLEIVRDIPKATKKQLKEYDELCSNKTEVMHTGWHTKGYTPRSQMNMWYNNKTEDALDPDTNKKLKWVQGESLSVYAELIESLDEAVSDVIDEFCQGTIDYKEYSSRIKMLNKDLKSRNAKVKVNILPQGEVLEKAMTMQPWEHLKYDNAAVEKSYDDARLTNYQTNYGGYGWV